MLAIGWRLMAGQAVDDMSRSPNLINAQAYLEQRRRQLGINPAPRPETAVGPAWMRALQPDLALNAPEPVQAEEIETAVADPGTSSHSEIRIPPAAFIKLYPDFALALLRDQQTAVGRVWLLLRHLDTDGRGWVTVKAARAALAKKGSPLKVVGWRRLRQIL